MTDFKRIVTVQPLEGRELRLWFSDGAIIDVDLTELLATGEVFQPIRDDRSFFEQVRVNPESETIEWPGEVDLDPDVLYGSFEPASGERISRRVVTTGTSAAA